MVLVSSVNYGRSGNKKNKASYFEVKKKAERGLYQANVNQERKDLEPLCRWVIRNQMCLKLASAIFYRILFFTK